MSSDNDNEDKVETANSNELRKINVFIDGTVIECGGYLNTIMELPKNISTKNIDSDDPYAMKKLYRRMQKQLKTFLLK